MFTPRFISCSVWLSVAVFAGSRAGVQAQNRTEKSACVECVVKWSIEAKLGSVDGPDAIPDIPYSISRNGLGQYVLGFVAPHLPMVFDSSGRFVRAIGQRGQGPG